MYNRSGRAYPDVSALGINGFIVIDNIDTIRAGTSMSTPLWAGIVSILNSHSIKITGKTLGFLNPLLYKMAKECPDCFHDITVGNNKCTENICTDQCKGFQAACGWDPVTGLGSPQFGNMLQYITKLLKKKINKTEYK
jgi:tripeptidyl-peptidase-1